MTVHPFFQRQTRATVTPVSEVYDNDDTSSSSDEEALYAPDDASESTPKFVYCAEFEIIWSQLRYKKKALVNPQHQIRYSRGYNKKSKISWIW